MSRQGRFCPRCHVKVDLEWHPQIPCFCLNKDTKVLSNLFICQLFYLIHIPLHHVRIIHLLCQAANMSRATQSFLRQQPQHSVSPLQHMQGGWVRQYVDRPKLMCTETISRPLPFQVTTGGFVIIGCCIFSQEFVPGVASPMT